jgi:hypothetical protein
MANVAVGAYCPNDGRLVACSADEAKDELVGTCDTCGTQVVQGNPARLGVVFAPGGGVNPHQPASRPVDVPPAFTPLTGEPNNPNDYPAPPGSVVGGEVVPPDGDESGGAQNIDPSDGSNATPLEGTEPPDLNPSDGLANALAGDEGPIAGV